MVATALIGAVAIGGGGLLVLGRPAAASPTASPASAMRHVAVVRTTLVATQPVNGVVTSSQTWTIGLSTGSSPDEVAAAGDAIAAAGERLSAARAALSDARQARSLVDARDRAAVATAPAGIARAEATRTRTLDRLQQDGAVSMAAGAVADARRELAAAGRDLAARRRNETRGGATVTAIPAPGTRIERGEAMFALDGRATILLLGETPSYRALREGDEGPDVAELQANLVTLAVGGTPGLRTDGTFDRATTLAVERWQTANRFEPTGIVRLGDVIVLPAAARVTAVHVAIGGAIQPGNAMLDVASVDEVIKLEVDPALASRVHVHDPIRFAAPDGADIEGTIASVSAPVMSEEGSGNGPPGRLVLQVVAAPADPSAITALDGAVLQSAVTTGTAEDVLAVPVAALVVLGDGAFGVEVASGGSTHFVRVTPGIYDRTMVEIEADGVTEGDQVVVPGA
jgi:hypothetical protein